MKNMTRPLTLCDLDFTDLRADDDKDDLLPRSISSVPPPPPMCPGIPPPMKPMNANLEQPQNFRHMNGSKTASPNTATNNNNNTIKKNKKTVCTALENAIDWETYHVQLTNISRICFFIGEIVLEGNSRGFDSSKRRQDNLGRNTNCNNRYTTIRALV